MSDWDTTDIEFSEFPKMSRLNRDIVITEKIDGTNAAVGITDTYDIYAQSRKKLIYPTKAQDNMGFARWVEENADALKDTLGPGLHFGEWWGNGIQRGYGLANGDKRFSLFNTHRWTNNPELEAVPGLGTVPILYTGAFSENAIKGALEALSVAGSMAALGYDNPEGVVVFHTAARFCFKVTLQDDEKPKSLVTTEA